MKKVVVDTNILVSASFWEGNPYKVMRLVVDANVLFSALIAGGNRLTSKLGLTFINCLPE